MRTYAHDALRRRTSEAASGAVEEPRTRVGRNPFRNRRVDLGAGCVTKRAVVLCLCVGVAAFLLVGSTGCGSDDDAMNAAAAGMSPAQRAQAQRIGGYMLTISLEDAQIPTITVSGPVVVWVSSNPPVSWNRIIVDELYGLMDGWDRPRPDIEVRRTDTGELIHRTPADSRHVE